MKKTTKVLSFILSIIIVIASLPLSAFADEAPTIVIENSEPESAEIYVSDKGSYQDYPYAVIEKSYDNQNWTELSGTVYVDDSQYVNTEPKKEVFYRFILYKEEYNEETGNYEWVTAQPSNSVSVKPNLNQIAEDLDYAYTTYNSKKINLYWEFYKNYAKYIDGFKIYSSVNGAAFKHVKTVAISSKTEYSASFASPSQYYYSVKYKICPYYVYNSKTFQGDSRYVYASYFNPKCVTYKTKKDAVILTFKNLSGAKLKIEYTPYNIKKRKWGKTKTVYTTKKSYKLKNNSKTTALEILVSPYEKNIYFDCTYIFSHEGTGLLNGAGKTKVSKIKVINTRGKKVKNAWTETLTKKDKKIIKKFFDKKYKGKNPSRAEMALYAFNFIHSKVQYAYTKDPKTKKNLYKKIAGKSYVDAIFNYRLGQCLQYNGAMAKVLAYLGYETRIIQGYRRNKVEHFWCEVKINGRWYLVETGNEGKNGSWQHFVELYGEGMGYTKCGKTARDE